MKLRAWLGLALLGVGCRSVDPELSLPYALGLTKEVVKSDDAWREACKLPPGERIGLPAPVELAAKQGREVRPVAPELVLELRRVIEGLPTPIARLFDRHVCGVVLVHGSPMSGTLAMLAQDPARGIIVLDVDKLLLRPNEWMTFKESSPFLLEPDQRIVGKLAEPADDVRSVLLEFLLVHELGHVIDSAEQESPLVASFKRIGWPRTDALAEQPLIHYPARKRTSPLPAQHVEPYFDLIAGGPYASPAAVSGDHEDFADSLATFVHTVLRGRPWQIELYQDGQLRRRLTSCWTEPRCKDKRALLEGLLERWLQS